MVQGKTLRVDLYADVPFIDPAYDSSLRYFSSGWQVSRLTGFKLRDFPDTGGAAGSTLRPEAATAMPKVSKDGKTYTFAIRKEFRFSSGERVTAASFAIDRAELVRGFRGTPTDQLLPPGMPGYRNATIYPAKPDLGRATALAQGNLRGGAAELWVPATFTSIGAIVKANLAQIGIDVTVKGIDPSTYATAIRNKGEPFDMALNVWAGDSPDPYDFIDVLLSGKRIQEDRNSNVGHFDDASFNRRMERSARLSGQARSNAYGQLDVDLMKDAAPIAAYLQRNNRILVSSSVGCFDYHFWYGTQLGSLCPK